MKNEIINPFLTVGYESLVGIELPRETFDTIYTRFDGVTWYVQVDCA